MHVCMQYVDTCICMGQTYKNYTGNWEASSGCPKCIMPCNVFHRGRKNNQASKKNKMLQFPCWLHPKIHCRAKNDSITSIFGNFEPNIVRLIKPFPLCILSRKCCNLAESTGQCKTAYWAATGRFWSIGKKSKSNRIK